MLFAPMFKYLTALFFHFDEFQEYVDVMNEITVFEWLEYSIFL